MAGILSIKELEAMTEGQIESIFAFSAKALEANPNDYEARILFHLLRDTAVREWLARARVGSAV
jgi:hypothetical protein